jgi:hypothetical protein
MWGRWCSCGRRRGRRLGGVEEALRELRREAKEEVGVRMERRRVRWRKNEASCERLLAARDAGREVSPEDVKIAEAVLATRGLGDDDVPADEADAYG